MKALVVHDSQWGNTERIARAIRGALGEEPDVLALPAGQAVPERLTTSGLDLLVVGSPTQGFRPTKPVAALLDGLPAHGLDGTRVAANGARGDDAVSGAGRDDACAVAISRPRPVDTSRAP